MLRDSGARNSAIRDGEISMLTNLMRCCSVVTLLVACSDGGSAQLPGIGGAAAAGGRGGSNSGGSSGVTGGSSASGGTLLAFGGMTHAGNTGSGADSGGACASQSAKAEVLPVYLAFAFDRSGSMGKLDKAWHDPALKWNPVATATKAFFTDPASAGLSASLTFFPDQSNVRCTVAAYTMPDVPMTELPSEVPGAAIDTVGSQDWLGGTPTLYAIRGVISFVQARQQATPGRYVIVLVTDGYPEGCDDDDDMISAVSAEVSAVAATIPTYVIGVANPPISGAPETVVNLTQVAMAGGTGQAYIINTGDPIKTTTSFKAAVDSIRGAAISCDARIPPAPAGSTFDKQKVAVSYTSGGSKTALTYDAACSAGNSWHYDDPANPTQVVLCPSTCSAIQADPNAALSVEFSCKTQIQVPL
jgi:hypothetical protein